MTIEERIKALQRKGFYMTATFLPSEGDTTGCNFYISRWGGDSFSDGRFNFNSLGEMVDVLERIASEWQQKQEAKSNVPGM